MKVIDDAAHPIKMWTDGVPVEEAAVAQLRNLASLPFIFKHVAVMPDVHLGKGATVGSVVPTVGAIVPAAVGVDIGCGMEAACLGIFDLPDDLGPVRAAIEAAVPHGRTNNGGPGDKGAWETLPGGVMRAWQDLTEDSLDRYPLLMAAYPKLLSTRSAHPSKHLGTLGTGNHFIELCYDEEGRVWLMLHSGSRGIGNRIGSFFIELAKREMEKWFVTLPDADLAYLPQGSEHFAAYCHAVSWAQDYAAANRWLMLKAALAAVRSTLGFTLEDGVGMDTVISCHHNYVRWEKHFGQNVMVTRKGAVCAAAGVLGIIPGSMGQRSYIVRGKGNRESFNSCSHGAGRVMSRTEARRRFSTADLEEQTAGVECRKDEDVIDEIPGAYKNLDAVMYAQADLVEVVHTLKAVLTVKG